MAVPAAPLICRLLEDPPLEGATNMAIDEAILFSSGATARPTLRFYSWCRPTLSLGYFQAHAERRTHAASRSCALIRRSTGGGAIVHDRELTYSLIWPSQKLPSGESPLQSMASEWLYKTVHEALIRVLGRRAVQASLAAHATTDSTDFLCFKRRSVWDMLIGGVKVLGSAQRRSRGAILQHGSLILATSKHAPEIAGLAEVARGAVDTEAIASLWAEEIAAGLNLRFEKVSLENREKDLVEEIAAKKYDSLRWTQRR